MKLKDLWEDNMENSVGNIAINNVEDISELYFLIAELTKRVEKLEDRAGLAKGRRDKTIVEVR